MTVYWLQRRTGTVLLRSNEGYTQRVFEGGPTDFKAAVYASLLRAIELWVGDQPLGPPRRLTIVRGNDGLIDATIADHGNGLTFAVHNMATEFSYAATLALQDHPLDLPPGMSLANRSVDQVEFVVGNPKSMLSAQDIDKLITALAEFRSKVRPEVTYELKNIKVLAEPNPAWRTTHSLHPGLSGPVLNLRHSGFGWLGYILPLHEARNLGKWLVDYAEQGLKVEAPLPTPGSEDKQRD